MIEYGRKTVYGKTCVWYKFVLSGVQYGFITVDDIDIKKLAIDTFIKLYE